MIKEDITSKVKETPADKIEGDSMKKVKEDMAGKFQLIVGVILLIGSIVAIIYTRKYLKEGNLFSSLQETGIQSLQISGPLLTMFDVIAVLIILMLVWFIIEGFSKMLNSRAVNIKANKKTKNNGEKKLEKANL